MIARRLSVTLLLVAVGAVVFVIARSQSGAGYHIILPLADAEGLSTGSPVTIGGDPVGTVAVRLDRHDNVIADVTFTSSRERVGRNVSASIESVNLLGAKELAIAPGSTDDPAPSGYVVPAGDITTSTDLDQVLDVLDPTTRTRLALLIDQAGEALTGSRTEFSQLLGQLPPSMLDATTLLNQLVGDNDRLTHVVSTTDQFVSALVPQRRELNHAIDVLGEALTTAAQRRAQLGETIARAPRTLITLQGFLHRLQATARPLGPAAQEIATTAPYLSATLHRVGPFARAADPTLRTATAVAPELTELARGATPTLRQASPVVALLATLSTALVPVTATLNHSVDNILAIPDNWDRAIELGDNLSHVFRGEASVTPDTLTSLIDRLLPSAATKRAAKANHRPGASRAAGGPATGSTGTNGSGATRTVAGTLAGAGAGVGHLLGGVTGTVGQIVGSLGSGLGKTRHGTPATSPPSPASLASLLGYLLKP